jgi:SAM-dependent methyltransferase
VQREDWDEKYAAVEHLWAARPNRFLVVEVADLPPGRVLDLACGEGQNAIWLATLGWKVTGVDFSGVAIAKAQARAASDGIEVDFVCADVLQYEPEPSAFDLVLLLYFHLPPDELRTVLTRGKAALAEGGTILIIGHDWQNLTDGVGGPQDPTILYAPDEIAEELPGLEIEKATQVFRDIQGEERKAIDALVRARRRSR